MASSSANTSHAKRLKSPLFYERRTKKGHQEVPSKEAPLSPSHTQSNTIQDSSSKVEVYDKAKFNSKEHEEEFRGIAKKTICLERPFIINEDDWFLEDAFQPTYFEEIHEVYNEIKARKWGFYCAFNKEGYESTIFHFYANMNYLNKEHPFSSFVEGVEVKFDPSTINKILKTPFPTKRKCELDRLMSLPLNAQEVLDTLCVPGAKWTVNKENKAPNYLLKPMFTPLARIWLAFVQNMMFPTLQKHKVHKKRVLATYCLVKKLPINIGLTIANEMIEARTSSRASLPYGCLISSICMKFGAKYQVGFPIPKQNPITKSFLHTHIFGEAHTSKSKNPSKSKASTSNEEPSNKTLHSMLITMHKNMASIHERQELGLLMMRDYLQNHEGVDTTMTSHFYTTIGGFDTIMKTTPFFQFPSTL